MLTFVERPEAWAGVRAAGTLASEAVTELLRWTSPGQHVMRTALRDVELGGARIEGGDRVTCRVPSANRDESDLP